MNEKQNYPKMLYKALASKEEAKGFIQSNERIGYIIVQSLDEEQKVKRKGWVNHPTEAEIKLNRIDKINTVKTFLVRHWKYWVNTIIAILMLIVAYMALK